MMDNEYIEHLKEIIKETESRATEWINKYSDLEEKYLKLTQELNNAKFVKIKDLREEIKQLQRENKELKQNNIQKLKNENKLIQKVHNERGAGRKTRFTDAEIETIRMYRLQGKKIKEIAEMFDCSVGLIHKLVNEKSEKFERQSKRRKKKNS